MPSPLAVSSQTASSESASPTTAIPVLEESIRHSREQHQSILDAIASGDSETARAAMLEHISATAALLRALT